MVDKSATPRIGKVGPPLEDAAMTRVSQLLMLFLGLAG